MKKFKSAIAIFSLLAFLMPTTVAAQDHKKNKGKNKAKQSQGMKAKKAKGNNKYKVTPQNHGQYVKQLRMASKRLKDLMKGNKKGRGKNKGKWKQSDYVVVNSTILEVAANIDRMLYRIERTRNEAELAALDIGYLIHQQQQTLQTISNVSKMHYDSSLSIVLEIGF